MKALPDLPTKMQFYKNKNKIKRDLNKERTNLNLQYEKRKEFGKVQLINNEQNKRSQLNSSRFQKQNEFKSIRSTLSH
jgi:hypothetical protein